MKDRGEPLGKTSHTIDISLEQAALVIPCIGRILPRFGRGDLTCIWIYVNIACVWSSETDKRYIKYVTG